MSHHSCSYTLDSDWTIWGSHLCFLSWLLLVFLHLHGMPISVSVHFQILHIYQHPGQLAPPHETFPVSLNQSKASFPGTEKTVWVFHLLPLSIIICKHLWSNLPDSNLYILSIFGCPLYLPQYLVSNSYSTSIFEWKILHDLFIGYIVIYLCIYRPCLSPITL